VEQPSGHGPELVTVRFQPSGAQICVAPGSSVLKAAYLAGVPIEADCGGRGSCGRCRVRTSGALDEPTDGERALLDPGELAAGVRFACRARVVGDATIQVTAPVASATSRIVTQGDASSCPAAFESPAERGISPDGGRLLGMVADIGTTTLVVALVDLETGRELGTAAALNPQHTLGHDVMSRIAVARDDGVEVLQSPLLGEIERLALDGVRDAGARPEDVREVAVVGNTAMIMSFLGVDMTPLAAAPYEPAFTSPVLVQPRWTGLTQLPAARVYALPGASAFIGSDVVAGMLATGLASLGGRALYLDLGTNAEMVLVSGDRLLAASAAAGPALEGAEITRGMRAESGAIERVWVEGGDLSFGVVGDTEPRGICGSGLLDLIAELLDAGVLDASGRLLSGIAGPIGDRVAERGDQRVLVLADARDIVLTQKDVRQVQLAKGAIRAGIDLLLGAANVDPADVEEVVVAGGFGLHVRAEALVRMGMLPAIWEQRVSFVGNAAKAGGLHALLSRDVRTEALLIAQSIETLDLAAHPSFQERFIAAMELARS
jgi:uncharacterized 2Fe-2S/4Fe-4S cluster protein (DUF4445 family)